MGDGSVIKRRLRDGEGESLGLRQLHNVYDRGKGCKQDASQVVRF